MMGSLIEDRVYVLYSYVFVVCKLVIVYYDVIINNYF